MYLSSMSLHLSGHWEHIKVASLKIALNLALCKVYVNNVLPSWYECIYIYTENTSTEHTPNGRSCNTLWCCFTLKYVRIGSRVHLIYMGNGSQCVRVCFWLNFSFSLRLVYIFHHFGRMWNSLAIFWTSLYFHLMLIWASVHAHFE